MIRKRNLDPSLKSWIMNQIGPSVGEVFNLALTDGAYYQKLLDDGNTAEANIFSTVLAAYNALTTNRNDVILMQPELFSATPAMTWAKSNCHILGQSPPAFGYNPAYFTHTADQDVWWTISGANNSFQNVRLQHGGTSATNAHCLEVTGAQNRFFYVHFDGPETSNEAAVSGYDLVKISEEYSNFTRCLFGNPWNSMTDVSALVGFTGNKNCTSFFKDCTFQKACGNTTSLFIHTYQSLNGGCHILFDNCVFQNTGTSTPQYAIDGYGLNTNNAMMTFHNSTFCGVTDVVATTYAAYVWFTGSVYASATSQNGLAANPAV